MTASNRLRLDCPSYESVEEKPVFSNIMHELWHAVVCHTWWPIPKGGARQPMLHPGRGLRRAKKKSSGILDS